MITSSHYIGEVIDELATIGQQVAMRNRIWPQLAGGTQGSSRVQVWYTECTQIAQVY